MYGFCNLSEKKTVYQVNVIDITDWYVEKNRLTAINCLILILLKRIKYQNP